MLIWSPCFVDPWRGIAHFDGLTIEADPISSGRPNRVLPCIEDEQVYFCRMMKALLPNYEDRNGRLAIDLGTGSGILSLYAGLLGMRVTGIDFCERAIDFATYNLHQNRQALPVDGHCINFLHCDWNNQNYLKALDGTADYVLINPPFSPCMDGYDIPTCASGGARAQDAFLQALEVAHSLLKEQGRVFVVQLLLTDQDGLPVDDVAVVTESHDARWTSVRIFPAFQEKVISVQEFLACQYRGHPKVLGRTSLDNSNKYFCLAFIELTKGKVKGKTKAEIISPPLNPLAPLPNWTWGERIRMHRVVSGGDTNTNSFASKNRTRLPSISLFLQRATPLVSSCVQSEDTIESDKRAVLTPTQIVLDSWIQNNIILRDPQRHESNSFDCIMVEAAPWHLARSRLSLHTETAIWTRDHNDSKGRSPKVSRALGRVLAEIKRFHEEKRSIFLHRELVVGSESRAWQEAICLHRAEVASDAQQPLDPSQIAPPVGGQQGKSRLAHTYIRLMPLVSNIRILATYLSRNAYKKP